MPKLENKPIQRRRSSRLATIKRTRNNIVVFKVITGPVDQNLTKKDLLQHFSSYGKVKEFSIVKPHTIQKNTCKVTYYNPISAANLLRDRYIQFNNNTRITINPSESWEQPFQITTYNNDEDSLITSKTISQQITHILGLNDYCLEIIFNYLDIKSQLSLSFCHERLEYIFINMVCSRSISPNLNINELYNGKFSDWELWQFFKTAGQFIRHIEFYSEIPYRITATMESKYIDLMIEEFCSNIQRVTSINRDFLGVYFFDVVNINLLTEIELYNCGIIDQDLEKFIHCSNLISLGLARNTKLLGDVLPRFKNLQHLSVCYCDAIKADNLMEACRSNINLKYLDMRCMSGIAYILKHCSELETLKIFLAYGKECEEIMSLTNLKSLEIKHSYDVTSVSLKTLYEKLYDNLEILKLTSYSSTLLTSSICNFRSLRTLWLCLNEYTTDPVVGTIASLTELEELYIGGGLYLYDSDMSAIIENCHKLKRFCISDCKRIKNDTINSFYNILEKRYFNTPTTSAAAASKQTLTIYLCRTGVPPIYVEYFDLSPKYNKKLLKLKKFHAPPLMGLLSNDLPFNVPYKTEENNDEYYCTSSEDEYYDSDDEEVQNEGCIAF